MAMSALQAEQTWQQAFPGTTRPKIFASNTHDSDGFKPLSSATDFNFDIEDLTETQLFAVSANNAHAMQLAQQEYIEISREIAAIKNLEKAVRDPQALDTNEVFQNKKEAVLYGYTYRQGDVVSVHATKAYEGRTKGLSEQEIADSRLNPEPFLQGGLVFKLDQQAGLKKFQAKIRLAADPNNPDEFIPEPKAGEDDGKVYIPVQQALIPEYTHKYTARNAILPAEDENAAAQASSNPDTTQSTQQTQNGTSTPSKPQPSNNRNTRFKGMKVPNTRDVSEAPSGVSTPKRKRPTTPVDNATREGTPSNKRAKPNTNPSALSLAPINNTAAPLPFQPYPYQHQQYSPYYQPASATPEPPKKKPHPNQHTKARENREREAAAAVAAGLPVPAHLVAATNGSAPLPDFRTMTTEQKFSRKWTDAELLAAVKEDHAWLNERLPAKAEEWRDKLINGKNPVRSFAMLKKWRHWQSEGNDKRPRNKGPGGGRSGSGSQVASPAPEGAGNGELGIMNGGSNGFGGGGGEDEVAVPSPGGRPVLSRRSTRGRGE